MSESYELQFGDLDWSPLAQTGDVRVSVHGLRRGKAVPVVSVVESLIQDGALERVERHDNRDQQVILAIDADDSLALAEYESALFRECQKPRNELRYTPPDTFGPTGVFDILWADLAFADEDDLWDLDETLRGRRNYVVTFRALPFARSVDPFTVTGVTSTGTTTTVVNDASSTTGWTNDAGVAPSSGSGEVWVAQEIGYFVPRASLFYQPASPINMTGLPYLAVRWRVTGGAGPLTNHPLVFADGLQLPHVATVGDGPGGTNRYSVSTYSCPDSSVARLQIMSVLTAGYVDGATSGEFRVDEVRKTDVAPRVGTLRQKVVNVEAPGSARCPMSLSVQHETAGLGVALIYTSPALRAGYAPPLSPWAVFAGATESANVSGQKFDFSSGSTESFDIPAAFLPPGSYQLVGRIKRASGGADPEQSVVATAEVRLGGTSVMESARSETTYFPNLSTGYGVYELGAFTLPPAGLPESSAAVVRISFASLGSVIDLDEAWLFYLPDDGSSHLSIIPCGDGVPAAGGVSNRLWLDAASVERPYPAAFIGTQSDRSDSRAPLGGSTNWDAHLFPAGENLVFVVTTGALDALVTGEGYARWHTHPAA